MQFVSGLWNGRKVSLIWILSLIFLFMFTAWGADGNQDTMIREKRGTPANANYLQEGTETEAGVQFFQRSLQKPLDELSRALREARKQGNTQEVKRIEELIQSRVQKGGEAAGDQTIQPSTTVGYPGEAGQSQDIKLNSNNPLEWVTDIHVRAVNTTIREDYPALATSSNGTIYCGWENVESGSDKYIQLYYSTDNGETWIGYGFLQQTGADLTQPSIAIGEGNADSLFVAYVVDNGVDIPHIEVAKSGLTTPAAWVIKPIPYLNFWEEYGKPVIWTDSYDFTGWYVYLTAEAIVSSATNNFNVAFWRSTDYGSNWSAQQTPLGNNDAYFWQDPDGTFAGLSNDIFIACFNATDNSLYTLISTSYGSAWSDTVMINTVTTLPVSRVDPDIEAATGENNIMLVCTKGSVSNGDDIGQTYSTDGGLTWSSLFTLNGSSNLSEFAPELNANEGGGSWHLTYTSNNQVFYSRRPQDLSTTWQATPEVVDDAQFASATYPKKGITSNRASDEPGIAWADYRDGLPDYDIYFDHNLYFPEIAVTPTAFNFVVQSGSGTTDVLTIDNTGIADLIWNMTEANFTLESPNGQKLPLSIKLNDNSIRKSYQNRNKNIDVSIDATLSAPQDRSSEKIVSNEEGIQALGDIIKSFAAPGNQPWGITWDGGNLWVACRATNTIYQIDSVSGGVLNSIPDPNTQLTDITFDGTYIWSTGYDQVINKIDPSTGSVVQSFSAPTPSTGGLAFDGTNLWVSGFGSADIYRVDPSNGNVLGTIPAPGTWGRGMTYDGQNLWIANTNSNIADTLYKVDPSDGTVLASFGNSSIAFPVGITTDGTYLWVTAFSSGFVYKIDAGGEIGCPWISEDPDAGIIPAGGSQPVDIMVDAAGMAPGDYFCDLVISSNDPAMPEVVVPVTLTVLPEIVSPQIGLSSNSFSFSVEQGSSDSDVLTLSNNGSPGALDLEWVMTEQDMTEFNEKGQKIPIQISTSKQINLSPVPENARDLAEPSSGPSKVKLMPGYLPMTGFTEDLMVYNGPFINSPNTGVGGADESVLQTVSLSMTTLGFGHQVSAGNRIADDFTITASADIDSIIFFAYQSSAPTTSTITAVNYRIWDGPPDNPASNVVFGDTLTNRLIHTEWTGVYRVSETTSGTATNRPIMKNTVSAGTTLPVGTYWLDWQSDGSVSYSGPWAPPITINGENTTGNGMQYTGAWAPVLDTGSGTQQGFPFWIYGQGGGDCLWLTKSPESGSVSQGGTQDVQIMVDASGLAVGNYSCDLLCYSNDPANPQVTISVQMQVTPQVGINDPGNSVVTKYELFQNYPNPFNPTTTIVYQLPNMQPQLTRLYIFNSTGQLIRTLVDDMQENGVYRVVWDGLNSQGKEVSSGLYFYQIKSGDFVQTNKLLKLK